MSDASQLLEVLNLEKTGPGRFRAQNFAESAGNVVFGGQILAQAIVAASAIDEEKVLKSVIANAQNRNEDVDVDELYVSEAYVNEGPRMKRVRPAPMGRAYRYQRRMAHIVIRVADKEEV